MEIMPDKLKITIVHLQEIIYGLQDGDLLDDLAGDLSRSRSLITHLKLCIMEIMPDKLSYYCTLIGNNIWASRW